VKKGDVIRLETGGFFYKITDIRLIGNKSRVYFEGRSGTRHNLSFTQMKKYKVANDHPENPWRTK
jgi:hypothetical protein